jgi:cytoskeletal protein CcmA (bactofilin family)
MEESEALQQGTQRTERFYLCGEGCLYRKLSAVLMPQLAQTSSRQSARDARASSASPKALEVRGPGNSIENIPSFSLTKPAALAGLFGFRKDIERTVSETARSSHSKSTGAQNPPTKLRESAAIGEGMKITGQVQSEEALYVNGELAGTLEMPAHHLTVGPNGKFRAKVWAKEVEIFGVIEGDVKADKIVIRKKARLVGNIWTLVLVIEGGACFEGKSRMGLLEGQSLAD